MNTSASANEQPQSMLDLNYQTTVALRTLRPMTWIVLILLSISLLTVTLDGASNVLRAHLWHRYALGLPLNKTELSISDALAIDLFTIVLAAMIATWLTLLLWMYFAAKKMPALYGAKTARYLGISIVMTWLYPFVNLIRPFVAMKSIYAISRGLSIHVFTPLVGCWWGFWLFSLFAGFLAHLAGNDAIRTSRGPEAYVDWSLWHLFPVPPLLVSGILLARIIYAVDRGQERRRSHLIAKQQLTTVPMPTNFLTNPQPAKAASTSAAPRTTDSSPPPLSSD